MKLQGEGQGVRLRPRTGTKPMGYVRLRVWTFCCVTSVVDFFLFLRLITGPKWAYHRCKNESHSE